MTARVVLNMGKSTQVRTLMALREGARLVPYSGYTMKDVEVWQAKVHEEEV